MIEEFLFLAGCPICQNGIPAVVTISFKDPHDCTYGHIEGLNKKQFIEIHQSHRTATIIMCKHLEVEEE
tara:strand:+ start:254 stop:460 length:207 start_codon:yes stop_codon:yes gene_type:complete